jgi:hypothetical protein
MMIGMSSGSIALMSRDLSIAQLFESHSFSLSHLKFVPAKGILLSIGNDDANKLAPTVKMWSVSTGPAVLMGGEPEAGFGSTTSQAMRALAQVWNATGVSQVGKTVSSNMGLRFGSSPPATSTSTSARPGADAPVGGGGGVAGLTTPTLVRTLSLNIFENPSLSSTSITAFAVSDDLSQMAIGLANGLVVLVRGTDISRDRFSRQRVVSTDGVPVDSAGNVATTIVSNPVTALLWKTIPDSTELVLYACTTSSVMTFWTSRKDQRLLLDSGKGCAIGAATQSDDGYLVVGARDAVYFYMPDSMGACFGFEGEKRLLFWFRGHLVVVGAERGGAASSVALYDLRNKFVAHRETNLPPITHVCAEWGSLFLLTADGAAIQLEERDMQTKLETLYRKNLYSVAVAIASGSQGQGGGQNDQGAVAEIYRRYGDHLYDKGDFDGAMQQYLQTIGKLEASYVIRKFLDAQRIHNLTSYLLALHEQGLAHSDHTTLTLNCLAKLGDVKRLDEFVRNDDRLTFDVPTAIRVTRQAGYYKHALQLARAHESHEDVLRILVDDLSDAGAALAYVGTLDFLEAEAAVKQYGKTLVDALPAETNFFLQRLCTHYLPNPASSVASIFGDPEPRRGRDESGRSGADDAPARSLLSKTLASDASPPAAGPSSSVVAPFASAAATARAELLSAADTARAELLGLAGAGGSSTNLHGSSAAIGTSASSLSSSSLTLHPPSAPTGSFIPLSDDDDSSFATPLRASPQDFIHLFVDQPSHLCAFLEAMVAANHCDNAMLIALLELYLTDVGPPAPTTSLGEGETASATPTGEAIDLRARSLDLLTRFADKLDLDSAMVLCRSYDFREGSLRLLAASGRFAEILLLHAEAKDFDAVLAACRQHGVREPSLWADALALVAAAVDGGGASQAHLSEVLDAIDSGNLLPPLMVLSVLTSSSHGTIPLGVVKDYLVSRLRVEEEAIERDARVVQQCRAETERMRRQVHDLRTGAVTFQASKCGACSSALDLPAVHFLCQHSYHQRCLGTDEESCPRCSNDLARFAEFRRAQDDAGGRAEEFFRQLEGSADGFSTVAGFLA